MHALTLLVASLTVAQPFETGPVPFDVSAIKGELRVVTDGKQHFIVYSAKDGMHGPAFYGDGKTFYRLRSPGGGASGTESFDISLWDPRIGAKYSKPSFSMKDSGKAFSVECGARSTAMTPLEEAAGKKMIESAAFKGPLWTRTPLALLRDEEGNYYFVDIRRVDDTEHLDHRVFAGPRGKLKLMPLKSIVDDSEGMILATRDGQLRLIAGKAHVGVADTETPAKPSRKWVTPKKETELVNVPLEMLSNVNLVYGELGVYEGQRLGTPCDDLM